MQQHVKPEDAEERRKRKALAAEMEKTDRLLRRLYARAAKRGEAA